MTEQQLIELVSSLSVSQKETDKQLKKSFEELSISQKETDKMLKELSISRKEADEQFKKFQKETDKILKKNSRSIRSLREFGINMGYSVEEFFYESFREKRKIGNMKFDIVSNNIKSPICEFDIVLCNKTVVGIVEVKHRLRPKYIKEFINKIPKFKTEFLKYKDYKIIAGMAFYTSEGNSKEIAQNKGLYVFSRHGQKIKTLNDEHFEARIF